MKAKRIDIDWRPEMPIYACESFLRTVGDEYGWLGGTAVNGHVKCIIPYVILRRPAMRIARFQTEVIYLDTEMSMEEERAFLNSAVESLRAMRVDLIMPGTNAAVFRTYADGAVAAPYGTFIQDLLKPEAVLLNEIHSTFRYNIRRATRDGVTVRDGLEHVGSAHELIADTLNRSGQAFKSLAEFKISVQGLGEHVKLLIAEREGSLQGCMVAPFSKHTAYTWYCGSRRDPSIGAMHLLHWEAMRRFKQLGVSRFNFQGVRIDPEEGSKQEGIMNFKRRFGGALVRGYTWKYPIRRLKFAAYDIAVRLTRGGDIVDLEHHKIVSSI